MLGFEDAKPRAVLSLQNWVDGNACIAREETKYLTQGNELLCVASPHDGAMTRLEDWVADKLIRFCKGFYKVRTHYLLHTIQLQAQRNIRVVVMVSPTIQEYTFPPAPYYLR